MLRENPTATVSVFCFLPALPKRLWASQIAAPSAHEAKEQGEEANQSGNT
jgi:hypothetical protein